MPKGGRRKGAGRPAGTGRFAETARSMRIPMSLVGPVSEMLADHLRDVSAAKRATTKRAVRSPAIDVPDAGQVSIIGPINAIEMLSALAQQKVKVAAVVLDPMYRAKREIGRAAYLTETISLIEAASRVSPHIFIWGFAESVARLVDHWPANLKLEGWLTWFFNNIPSRSKSWRPSQQACLHLRRRDGKMYPEHFYSDSLKSHARSNRLEFKMTPYSVMEADSPRASRQAPPTVLKEALLSGFIKRSEQTGFKMQKPEVVIEPLLRMTTKPGDLVVDPTAGSGTTGAVAIRLGCAAILSDRSAYALRICRRRLGQ